MSHWITLLSTHADGHGVDISFTVCLFVCTVTDFSVDDKANGVKFGVQSRESPILEDSAPPEPQNRRIGAR